MTLTIFIAALLGTMAIGVPIAFALIASAVCLMLLMGMFDTQIIAQNLINGADNFSLMAIPFFILAGELMNAGGISKRIINLALAMMGHIRGGLGYVAIMAALLFAGLSGSAVADTAALAAVLIPMMVKAGYDVKRSAGLIAAGGIIAPIIPPSIPFIIFGVSSGVSISKLFMGGIVPGIMMGLSLIAIWWLLARKADVAVYPRQSFGAVMKALKEAVWALFLPVLIIGGMKGGIFTPTEAAIVAAVYALFVGLVAHRELKLKDIGHSLVAAAKMTSVVMFLIAASMVASWMITIVNIPQAITVFLAPLIDQPKLLLMVIILLMLIVGTAMDLTPSVLIFTPILMPLVHAAGIDPVYFGVIFIMTNALGLLTPPVGTVLNVAGGVAKLQMEDMVKGVWPFLLAEFIVLLLLVLFPQLVTVPVEWLTGG